MEILTNDIYLDNSASTRLDERVLEEMKKYYLDIYAVATSDFAYSMGIEAKEALEKSREIISSKIKASKSEIVFTSGSSESSNMAIKGVAWKLGEKKGKHIITSKIEDFPVLNTIKSLVRDGYEVNYISVDEEGFVDKDELRSLIREDTVLVSIQHANQEIGTIQDIETIGDICRKNKVLFHVDATHTFTKVDIDVSRIKVDLLTISAHTIHGPRGVGALYIRKDTPMVKFIEGGFQEYNMRGGVENIPGIVGFGKAVELVTDEENMRLFQMRDYLINTLLEKIPASRLNGSREKRTPQNANVSFRFVEGESVTLHLDMQGIAVSTGSACFSKSLEGSHVIYGIGGDHERAHGSVRFTMGRFNSMEQVEKTADILSDIILKLRKISPLGKEGR
ncbi:cysteine desulfurase family protein [uncultured Ilyobacter sp.]|uniref:cysteine desulfurase family protein n=1 Tax=uncultured Ilyobacter sp. TaxID=544433 RepID=UPI0029C632AA|nr:cysteine desulfurase family protein [uncultured Ilyobacter sp.]